MINNNRQQNGRRRGRGGQRQGGGGNQGNGSRIDNRARGNAAQLLEKYKSLASEAQRQGDRVNTEYYLQFADHYFRVVSEQRGRFEEQDRGRRDTQGGGFDEDDNFDDGDDNDNRGEARDAQPQQREPRRVEGDRDGGRDGNRDGNRDTGRYGQRDGNRESRESTPRDNRNGRDRYRDERPAELPEGAAFASEGEPAAPEPVAERPRRARAPRRDQRDQEPVAPVAAPAVVDTFDIDRLPPSFAPANNAAGADEGGDTGEAEVKPRRRRLRTTSETTVS